MNNYNRVLDILIQYYGISYAEFYDMLRTKENKYLFLLLLKEFRGLNKDDINKQSISLSYRSLIYNLRKAEEKLLVNKEFREDYFTLQEKVEKYLKKL